MNAQRQELIAGILLTKELLRRRAQNDYKAFMHWVMPTYDMQWFHALICETLDKFERGEIKKLMIFLPPQHGKSELTTRSFPAYLVGKKPGRKVGVISYNSTLAGNFNRSIQRKIDSNEFLQLFPDTKLNESKYHDVREAEKQRTMQQLDILGGDGSIKTIGWGGSLTGFPLDIGIIDDPIKDREEALSPVVREKLYNWYVDVFKARLHNDSQQLLVQTRWHENDLGGRILQEDNDWVVIKLPALRTKDVVEYDPREFGEALWESKHSRERLEEIREKNQVTFNSLYQQDPKPNTEVLVYKDWIEIPEWPADQKSWSWGLDFGKTTGINALCKGVIVPHEPKHHAYLEEYLYAAKIPPSEIAKILFANGYEDGQIVWCDHMPIKIQELRLAGIAAFPAIKGPGSVRAGIDKMNEFVVHYRGKNIRMETNNYQFVVYDNIITNEPVDAFNHILDSARYCLLSRYFRE